MDIPAHFAPLEAVAAVMYKAEADTEGQDLRDGLPSGSSGEGPDWGGEEDADAADDGKEAKEVSEGTCADI